MSFSESDQMFGVFDLKTTHTTDRPLRLPVEMRQREMVDCPNFEEDGDDPKSARCGNGQRPLVRAERDGKEHG